MRRLNLPEDEGEGLGFRLTRTLWDPYPWVRDVIAGSRADSAGLRMGDCLLQADGKDLLGLPVGQVAGLIRGDGAGRGVSLLVWNCGVDPKDDPELLWSCGGGARGERSRRALSGVVKALACCVCASTATRALNCARSHIYCEACWSRLERCALCREPLPAKDSPYARNLVAEQVFEAIATEYDIKDALKKPRETLSAYNTPNRSPNVSPSVTRRGHYQLSLMNRKKAVHFNELGQSYGSDPNIHRSVELQRQLPKTTIGGGSEAGNTAGCQFQTQITQIKLEHGSDPNIHRSVDLQRQPPKTTISGSFRSGNTATAGCQCQAQIPQIKVEDADACAPCAASLQHKLVARLRHACSMADLQNAALQSCQLSRSLNSLGCCPINQTSSLENLKNGSSSTCGEYAPVPLGGGLLWGEMSKSKSKS